MKIGSYLYRGKPSYGALTDDGIVDLGSRLGGRFPDLLSVLKANALNEVRDAIRGAPADVA